MSEKINHQRCRFLGIAAMTIATTQLGRFGSAIAFGGSGAPAQTKFGLPPIEHWRDSLRE
jgi:hypothetical protein